MTGCQTDFFPQFPHHTVQHKQPLFRRNEYVNMIVILE